MYKLIRPLLFSFNAEWAHDQMHNLAAFLSHPPFVNFTRTIYKFEHPALQTKIFNLTFKNPLGTAAGFDKQGRLLNFLPALGLGHVQVGDVSSLPHPGNPKPRLFRLVKDQAIINRMGQNNKGADFIASVLKNRTTQVPVMASLVKTPDPGILGEKAVEDFVGCFKKLHPLADVSVLNISCPNTAEGKTFEEPGSLKILLDEIVKAKSVSKPILVKISPDVDFSQLDKILEICESHKIDGYILTNTSARREGLVTNQKTIQQIGKGGLSGQPLRQRSTEIIRHAYRQLKRPCIVGLGGVNSPESAYEKIKAGASLVQLYTGLIYEGPGLVKNINEELVKLLERDGFKNVSEAVGVESR